MAPRSIGSLSVANVRLGCNNFDWHLDGTASLRPRAGEWAELLAMEGYQRAIPRNDRVLTRNVPEAGKMVGVPEAEHQALKPLFIIELTALLDAIREQHVTVRTT